jgi:hypothetical protein
MKKKSKPILVTIADTPSTREAEAAGEAWRRNYMRSILTHSRAFEIFDAAMRTWCNDAKTDPTKLVGLLVLAEAVHELKQKYLV